MKKFLTPLSLVHSRGADKFCLSAPLVWINGDRVIIIPVGFSTDLASIPRVARWVIDNDEAGIIDAAVLHDWFFHADAHKCPMSDLTFNQANLEMVAAMKVLGASWLKRWLVYFAVSIFGKKYWKG